MHLTESEFIDLLDRALPENRRAHADNCADCRAHAEALAGTAALARTDTEAEPSPLFWEHFGARLNTAIDTPAHHGFRWPRWARVAFPVAAAAAALLAFNMLNVNRPADAPAEAVSVAAPHAPAAVPSNDDVEEDAAWAVVRAMTHDLDYEAVHAAGMAPVPGAAERAVLGLTIAEQTELVRLIQLEMKRPGA